MSFKALRTRAQRVGIYNMVWVRYWKSWVAGGFGSGRNIRSCISGHLIYSRVFLGKSGISGYFGYLGYRSGKTVLFCILVHEDHTIHIEARPRDLSAIISSYSYFAFMSWNNKSSHQGLIHLDLGQTVANKDKYTNCKSQNETKTVKWWSYSKIHPPAVATVLDRLLLLLYSWFSISLQRSANEKQSINFPTSLCCLFNEYFIR